MHRHVSTRLCLAALVMFVMFFMFVMAAPTVAADDPLPLPLPPPPPATIDDEAGWIDVAVPLPAVEEFVPGRVRLAAIGDPQDLQEPLLLDDLAPPGQPRQEFEPPAGRKLPPGAKPGMVQQAISTITELPKLGSDGLGLTVLDQSVTLGMPAPTVDSPLLITPGFGATLVDAPAGVDLPSTLYEGYIQARWLRKIKL